MFYSIIKKFAICFLGLYLLVSCQEPKKVNFNGIALGSYYSVSYLGEEDAVFFNSIDSLIKSFEAMASIFNTNSLVSKINANQTVELNEDFISIFTISQQVSALTNGAFDITVGPLVNIWGFGSEHQMDISQNLIDSIKQFVGYEKIALENNQIIKSDSRIQLNFNAVAKGYLVDKVAEFIVQKGYPNCLVDIGGEVVARGSKNGKPWQVGIQIPTGDAEGNEAADCIFSMKDKAVATSGNYRRYHEENGQRFSHIINPKTGQPEKSNLLSVTVVADNCAYADAFATAFMVMGMEASLKFLESHPEYAASFIYDENASFKHKKTTNFPPESR